MSTIRIKDIVCLPTLVMVYEDFLEWWPQGLKSKGEENKRHFAFQIMLTIYSYTVVYVKLV